MPQEFGMMFRGVINNNECKNVGLSVFPWPFDKVTKWKNTFKHTLTLTYFVRQKHYPIKQAQLNVFFNDLTRVRHCLDYYSEIVLWTFQNVLVCWQAFLQKTVAIQGFNIQCFYFICIYVSCACCCCWQIRQDRPVNTEDKGETLVIEGFRFESVTSREGLQRLCSQGGSGCHFRGATRDWWRVRLFLSDTVSKVKCLTELTTAGRWETTSSADDKAETKHFDPVWVLRGSF